MDVAERIVTYPGLLAVDTETNGKSWHDAGSKVGVVSFAWGADLEQDAYATRNVALSVALLQQRLDSGLRIVLHSSPFDLHHLQNLGLEPDWSLVDDTLILARLRNNLGQNDLKKLGLNLLGIVPKYEEDVKAWLRKNKGGKDYTLVPDELLLPYAAEDTRLTWLLHGLLVADVSPALYAREMRLQEHMFKAEREGVLTDPALIQAKVERVQRERDVLSAKLLQVRGDETFNPGSTQQVSKWLVGELGLSPLDTTPTGLPKMNELMLVSNPHPATRLLLAWRKRRKALEFLTSYLDLADADHVLHPSINTLQARTHRFSIKNPNLQQVPSRNDKFGLREVFISGEGYFIGADYDKQELFIAACEAQEQQLMTNLAQGVDVYTQMAASMLDKSEASVVPAERQAAKVAVLSIIYGAGAAKIAESFALNTGKPYTVPQAKVMRQRFKDMYPGLSDLMQELQQQGRRGKLRNRWERELRVEAGREYVATDYLVQSSGRDVLADALLNLSEVLPAHGGKLLWPVHDEVIMWMPDPPTPAVLKEVSDAMECTKFQLPLTASPNVGKTFAQLK